MQNQKKCMPTISEKFFHLETMVYYYRNMKQQLHFVSFWADFNYSKRNEMFKMK